MITIELIQVFHDRLIIEFRKKKKEAKYDINVTISFNNI